jgi:hypothetical protein
LTEGCLFSRALLDSLWGTDFQLPLGQNNFKAGSLAQLALHLHLTLMLLGNAFDDRQPQT